MELDSRIKEGKRPLMCFDIEEAEQFIGKNGYFSDCLYKFQNLDDCSKSILHCVDNKCGDSNDYLFNDGKYYCRFFLPVEWVKEPETKFVPYTLDTWGQDFKPGDVVFFKGKEDTWKDKNYYKCMYLGYLKNEKNSILVILGCWLFAFDELIDSFEIYRNGNWEPFGKKVNEGKK